MRVTNARWRGRAVEGKEERMERRRVERRLDGQDSKDAASQLRTSRWIRKPEGQMRDETQGEASGIREQKKREGVFDTWVCHIDPRYRKHPISNSEIKTRTKQTKNKAMESVPLSIYWRGKQRTGKSSVDIRSKMFASSTRLNTRVSESCYVRFNICPHEIISSQHSCVAKVLQDWI